MNVRIGFIGIEELESKIINVVSEFPNVTINFYFYQSEKETLDLALKYQDEVDVLLFGGPVPYFSVKDHPDLRKPSVYISYDDSALYKTLLEVTYKYHVPFEKISMDLVSKETVKRIFQDFQLDVKNLFIYPSLNSTSEKLTQYHTKLYENGKTDYALTCLRSTYQSLMKKKINCCLVLATESSIRDGIQKAILVHQNQVFRRSQIMVGLIEFRGKETKSTDYENKQLQLEIHQTLLHYAQKIDAGLFSTGDWTYVFYTTRGSLELAGDNILEAYFNKMGRLTKRDILIGLGIGATAQIAERRAKTAIVFSRKEGGNQCFISIDENKVSSLTVKFSEAIRTDDRHLQNLAKEHQMSPILLQKLKNISKIYDQEHFNADELANYLNQTSRNIRRILKKLVEIGLARPVGEEHFGQRGRPKTIYKITI